MGECGCMQFDLQPAASSLSPLYMCSYCVRTIQANTWVKCISLSDDGRLLATGGDDHAARVWDLTAGTSKEECREHSHVVDVIALAPVSAYAAIRELGGVPVSSPR